MRRPVSIRKRSGFILTTMAVITGVLLACVGLAIDAGYLQLLKTRMQIAADAAAMGGAQEIKANGPANVVSAAQGDAALNGFTNGVNGVTITIHNPPASGYSTSDSSAVEAIISQPVSPIFMGLIGIGNSTVVARGVAHQGSNGGGCLFAMDPSSSGAFSISNGVDLAASCGIFVNSNSATALTVTGGSKVTATSIGEVGGNSITGGSSVSPTPVTGMAAESDPLAGLPAPSVGACNHTNMNIGGGSTQTLSPGVYCGGININNGSHVTLNSGTYILLGGGLILTGGSTLTGTAAGGVTFYNTYNSTYAYGPISFSNGTTETLTAPTTGTYAGILFFQDRSVSGGVASTFVGGTSAALTGTLYFPTTTLSFSNGSSTAYTIIVCKDISFAGGATLNSNYSSLPAGSPIKGTISLSE